MKTLYLVAIWFMLLGAHPTEVVEPSESTLEYFAACVEAEAGNQGLYGKQLVASVILNRVDSNRFPDTIEDVINQPGAFSVVSSGRINRVEVTEESREAVRLTMEARVNSEILYFRTKHYHSWCIPCFKYKKHYFGK